MVYHSHEESKQGQPYTCAPNPNARYFSQLFSCTHNPIHVWVLPFYNSTLLLLLKTPDTHTSTLPFDATETRCPHHHCSNVTPQRCRNSLSTPLSPLAVSPFLAFHCLFLKSLSPRLASPLSELFGFIFFTLLILLWYMDVKLLILVLVLNLIWFWYSDFILGFLDCWFCWDIWLLILILVLKKI